MFDNLLANAISFSPDGAAVSVTISAKRPWTWIIVESYGGTIGAANREGGGARFEVKLRIP